MNPTESKTTSEPHTFKNNLFQNFYVIGFSPEDFFKVNKKENKGEFLDIFDEKNFNELNIIPKILTKFPSGKMSLNVIPDDIVIQHCFPNGNIQLTTNKQKEFFYFKFDNIPQNYESCFRKIYSNIYFTCLEIKEPLLNYLKYKNEIINLISENKSLELTEKDKYQSIGKDEEKKYSEIFISKVICFASVLPFYGESIRLLDLIYDYYLAQKNFLFLPLEKVIEKIILLTYIPLKPDEELCINLIAANMNKVITFPQNMLNEINIDYSVNISLEPLFKYFSTEDIVNIFRYVLYEIPILFFCYDKSICSIFVNVFLTLLSPFKYVFPHISILPKSLYGIIGSEKRFIFGINEIYQEDFFEKNSIELNKTIIIISINNVRVPPGKIEEKIYHNNNKDKLYIVTNIISKPTEDIVKMNNNLSMYILNVDIPSSFKKKLIDKINYYLSLSKKKGQKKDSPPIDISLNIRNTFFKFMVKIMEGYTDYLNKSIHLYNDTFTKNANIGENIFIKHNDKFKKEVFNEEEFILKSPRENFGFYKIFFKTEMFTNFLRERIYNEDVITQLAYKQFDQLTFLDKHSDLRKRKENKDFFNNFIKDTFEKIKIEYKNVIMIKEEILSKEDSDEIVKHKKNFMNILLNFGQYFHVAKKNETNDGETSNTLSDNLSYFIFPKLNFEYLSRTKSDELLLINNSNLFRYKNICAKKIEEYIKIRPYAFYTYNFANFTNLKPTSYSGINYQISCKYYINYIWFMLLTASIWYCEEEEKKYRLDKMLSSLNYYEIMEEYLLNFIFINIYKSASASYLVKFFIIYYKIVGRVNYYLLTLLCDKIQNNTEEESENSLKNNLEGKRDLVFSKRYLINPEYDFGNGDNNNEDTEELIFCSEQECEKCKEIIDIDVKKFIELQEELIEEWPKYKCPICKEFKDIKIKYQILKFNYVSKEILLTEVGEFTFLTPFKLYKELKSYFIKENTTKLDINEIFSIKNKINLYNVIFYFSMCNLNYDFLFPYEAKLKTNINMIFKNIEKELAKKDKKPIKLIFNNQSNFRKFTNIQPWLNIKVKGSKLLGLFQTKDKYIESDLSFTIKNSKNKKTKKK